jgi:hypothetical protein
MEINIKSDVFRRLVKHLALNVEMEYNNHNHSISEYDVQHCMYDFLRINLNNTKYKVEREREGKFDCVISIDEKPAFLLELKTYLKKGEKTISKNSLQTIKKDLIKLKKKKQDYPNSSMYFFAVVNKKNIKDFEVNNLEELDFFKQHNDNNKSWFEIKVDSEKIRLRPGNKQHIERVNVFSWEIK